VKDFRVSGKACAFCQIAGGELSAQVVLEDPCCLAFLDRRPLFPGHCLLVPREHVGTLGELPDELVAPLFSAARLLSRAVQSALAAEGSFVAINNVVSQSVPHLHVHVVPRRKRDGLKGFFWPRSGYRDAEHEREVQEALRAEVERLRGS